GERALAGSIAGDRTFFVVEAFNRADGRRLWQHRSEASGPLPGVHDKHNLASPSPVSDGQMVYAWFGTGQIVALDMNGKLVWERHLGKEIAPFDINWGHASSPTLFGDTLLLLCDHQPASYLLAVDKKTGRERWRADRGRGRMSYTTPFVVDTSTGPELIVNSSERVDAYDPRSGAFLWHVGGSNQFPIPAPTFHDGVVYLTRGYRSGPFMAVRPGGHGDRRGERPADFAAAGRRHLLGVACRGRREDLLRQRDGGDDRGEGGAPARDPRAKRSGRAADRVAGDLERAAVHPLRRAAVRDRQAVIAQGGVRRASHRSYRVSIDFSHLVTAAVSAAVR